MEPTILYLIIGICSLAAGVIAGKFIFSKNTEKQVKEAESKAENIIKEAQLRAETIKKEKALKDLPLLRQSRLSVITSTTCIVAWHTVHPGNFCAVRYHHNALFWFCFIFNF